MFVVDGGRKNVIVYGFWSGVGLKSIEIECYVLDDEKVLFFVVVVTFGMVFFVCVRRCFTFGFWW